MSRSVLNLESGGYGLRFSGDRAELEELLKRAFGREAIGCSCLGRGQTIAGRATTGGARLRPIGTGEQ